MDKHIPVEGHKHLVRDRTSGAILNINRKSIIDARSAKSQRLAEKTRVNDLTATVESMQNEIMDLKNLIQELVKHNG